MPERIFGIYKEIFRRMEELYFSDKEKYDSFGIILGQMSPDTFLYSKSADSAWFSEFNEEMQKIENPTLHDGYRVLKKMIGEYNHRHTTSSRSCTIFSERNDKSWCAC